MPKPSEVQSMVTPELHIVVNTEDAANNPISKTWRVILDYKALAIIEKTTGRDLKDYKTWSDLKSSEYPVFVHAGLHRYHPEVTLDDVYSSLNPGCQVGLSNAFFEMCFPGAAEAVRKAAEEKTAGATAVPNTETPVTS